MSVIDVMMMFILYTTILIIAEGSSSSQAPNLQPSGKENGGAIRGILGDCNEDLAMYHAFVAEDESYYCDLADTAYKSFKSKYYPDTELCDWGFGELIPRPYTDPITGDKHWQAPVRFFLSSAYLEHLKQQHPITQQSEWHLTPGTETGTTSAEVMFEKYACAASSSVALAGGSSPGTLVM